MTGNWEVVFQCLPESLSGNEKRVYDRFYDANKKGHPERIAF